MSEKFGVSKATIVFPAYTEKEHEMKFCKNYLNEVMKCTSDCVRPKIGSNLLNLGQTVSIDSSKTNNQFAERHLADCCSKYSKKFENLRTLSEALDVSSLAFYKIADARNRAFQETDGYFLAPNKELVQGELAQVLHNCEKAAKYRLDYDSERKKAEKAGSQANQAKLMSSEEKFKTAVVASYSGMTKFLEHEPEQIEKLLLLAKSQLTFYRDAARHMEALTEQLESKLELAEDRKKEGIENAVPGAYLAEPVPLAQAKIASARALYDFAKENTFDLTCKKGDILEILDQPDDNWYFARLHQEEGLVPITYVEIIDDPTS